MKQLLKLASSAGNRGARGAVPAPVGNGRRAGSRSARFAIPLCGLAVTLVLGAVSLYRPTFVGHLDGRSYDSMITADSSAQERPGPVVVAIDDQSLAKFGRWPWPRALVARLLARIAEQKPVAVGIDAIFAEPERFERGATLPGRRGGDARDGGAAAAGSGAAQPTSPGDRALAEVLASAPFVLGYEFTFAQEGHPPGPQAVPSPFTILSVRRPGESDPGQRLWQGSGVIGSRAEFVNNAAATGFLNAATEQDGIMRRMPELIGLDGRIYPSLALSTVLTASGLHQAVLESTWYGGSFLKVDGRSIPLDDHGRLLLRYRGWHGTIKPIPADALLEGRVPATALKGRVVFVGATAIGMGEAVATPVQALLSGVQVHAIAAENMLLGDLARPAPWLYQLLAVALLGFLSTVVCARLAVMRGALVLGVLAAGTWQGSTMLLSQCGLFLSPALPLITLLANFSLLTAVRSFVVERTSRRQAQELAKTRDFIMTSLTSLTEIRDMETGAHLLRTQRYLLILCRELSGNPRFRPLQDEAVLQMIAKLAPLHDIGKVGLPDQLLHKTTGFTDEEYAEVRKHTIYGRDTIANAERRAGLENDELLSYAKDMAYSHHERWDGSGYPEGLRGEAIPWAGRIMAVADAYDAIISKRVYKEPISHQEAVAIIAQGSGTLFDPEVVEGFLKVERQWQRVAEEVADPVEEES